MAFEFAVEHPIYGTEIDSNGKEKFRWTVWQDDSGLTKSVRTEEIATKWDKFLCDLAFKRKEIVVIDAEGCRVGT